MNNKGQIILVLILVMTVALAIGLSIVQKSLVDVSTASKVEQSSRAFSAAEAGIEKALKGDTSLQNFTDTSSKITEIADSSLLPSIPASGNQQAALEKPPLAKEEVAHVWLADFSSPANPPAAFYTQPTLDVYWGDPVATDKAALELTLVYYDGAGYPQPRKWYLDQISRNPNNGFEQVNGSSCANTGCNGYTVGTTSYQCKKILGNSCGINNGPLPNTSPNILILLRARLLYNDATSQPLAIQATGTCGKNCSLPPQQREIVSTGVSGETERRVKIIQESNVVPFYFDYAIFSAGDIKK